MFYVVTASTPGGLRRFVVGGRLPGDALRTLRGRIARQARVTDEFGGLYLGSDLDPESLRVGAASPENLKPGSYYPYAVDGQRIH